MKLVIMALLKISTDFSPYPGARYYTDGKLSGQEFYDTTLKGAYEKALLQNESLTVDLDGTAGYASSFLSESFGLLAENFGYNDVLKSILIVSIEEPDWRDKILKDYIPNAKNRKKREVVTA